MVGHEEQPLGAADRLEIRELVARYNVAMDARDPVAWASTFTEDGVFFGVLGTFRGTDQLREFIVDLASAEEYEYLNATQHWVDNLVIEGSGEEATLYCHHALLQAKTGGGGEILLMAEYHDRARKVGGRWLFAERSVRRVDLD